MGLPGGDLLQNGVSDHTDRIWRYVHPESSYRWPAISRLLIPRAYIETTFSSKPWKPHWY
jgi:hypothetical protein